MSEEDPINHKGVNMAEALIWIAVITAVTAMVISGYGWVVFLMAVVFFVFYDV